MKTIFEVEDHKETLRILKSLDMACFIFELTKNLHRRYENEEETHSEVFQDINDLLYDHNINIDELID